MLQKLLPILFALSFSTETALAQNCASYPLPYTLTNGTTADASQVMSNLNDIINCVNALNAVTGPSSSVAGHLATFANTAGNSIQDGGPFSVSAQYLANSAIPLGVTMLNGTLVPSNAANALTFTVQTLAGNTPSATDPVYFTFRNANAGTGNYSVISVTSALSVTIPTSSTLGFSNGVAGRIWIVALNNSGTVALAVINCLTSTSTSKSIYPLAGWGIITTTALGGPSNSSGVFYSTTAASSVPYGVLGYASYESGLTTAGTWNANPTRMELYRPGVPLPGVTVQMVMNSTTTSTTVAGTTKTATGLTASITPTSAANLIKIQAWGTASSSASSSNATLTQLSRGTTFTGIGTALVGPYTQGGPTSVPDALFAFDLPNTTSSTTYLPFISCNVAGNNCVWNGTSATGAGTPTSFIEVDEIMSTLEPDNEDPAREALAG